MMYCTLIVSGGGCSALHLKYSEYSIVSIGTALVERRKKMVGADRDGKSK
jgi:hypothetical protein